MVSLLTSAMSGEDGSNFESVAITGQLPRAHYHGGGDRKLGHSVCDD